MTMSTTEHDRDHPVLEVEDLTIQYETADGTITAVTEASFEVGRHEYFGLAGESGCGKSTIVKSILGILDENGKIESGAIRYKGQEIQDYSQKELNEQVRWKEIAYIPQSSMDSLDPLKRIDAHAIEIAQAHTDLGADAVRDRLSEMFEVVGIPVDRMSDYPHQFSGGMQQRAIIALSLFLEPTLLIADEPTTALDVIMQDQILKYMDRIKSEGEISMIMITHDISLIFETCDLMAIMHSGQIAEIGAVTTLYDSPRHPYSILLQEAFPSIEDRTRTLETIDGHPPQLTEEPEYCTFVDRCPWVVSECRNFKPELESIDTEHTTHSVACFRQGEIRQLYDQYTARGDIHGE